MSTHEAKLWQAEYVLQKQRADRAEATLAEVRRIVRTAQVTIDGNYVHHLVVKHPDGTCTVCALVRGLEAVLREDGDG